MLPGTSAERMQNEAAQADLASAEPGGPGRQTHTQDGTGNDCP